MFKNIDSEKTFIFIGAAIVIALLVVIFFVSPYASRDDQEEPREPEEYLFPDREMFEEVGVPQYIEEEERFGEMFKLYIDSDPKGASFYIDGKNSFDTPSVVELPVGEYWIWGYKEGYLPAEKNIFLEGEKELLLELEKTPEDVPEIEPQM